MEKMVAVRTLLSVVAARNRPVHQMGVQNAFLHGDLTKEAYMRPFQVSSSKSPTPLPVEKVSIWSSPSTVVLIF